MAYLNFNGLFTAHLKFIPSVHQFWCGLLPWVFDRKALHLQQLSQRIILTVNYVLPLFVIQLLPHDVLTQIVHHLHKIMYIRYHNTWRAILNKHADKQLTSFSVKTSSWAPATRRICRRGALGCTCGGSQSELSTIYQYVWSS